MTIANRSISKETNKNIIPSQSSTSNFNTDRSMKNKSNCMSKSQECDHSQIEMSIVKTDNPNHLRKALSKSPSTDIRK